MVPAWSPWASQGSSLVTDFIWLDVGGRPDHLAFGDQRKKLRPQQEGGGHSGGCHEEDASSDAI